MSITPCVRLTTAQLAEVEAYVAQVCASPSGNGEVTIVVKRGIPRYVAVTRHEDWEHEHYTSTTSRYLAEPD